MFNCYNNELTHDVEGKSIWGYYKGVSYAIEHVFYAIPTYLVIIGSI